MKKLLLLFSLTVALSFSSKAQTSVYHPFPDSDAVWNVNFTNDWSCEPYVPSFDYSWVMLNQDTSIGFFVYHRVTLPSYKTNDPQCSYLAPTPGTEIFIRQDTSSRKVFIWDNYNNSEYLLYDFNLQIGDTVQDYFCPGEYIISGIDSIMLNNNYRKRFLLIDPNIPDNGPDIIEGMGTIEGPFESFCIAIHGNHYNLTCFQQNGQTLYPDSSSACNIISSVNNLSEKNISITLSPNPFHTTATLKIYDFRITNYDLRIYDVMGRLVREQQIVIRNSEIVNRDGLGDGLYFYQLLRRSPTDETNNYELLATGKFVVE